MFIRVAIFKYSKNDIYIKRAFCFNFWLIIFRSFGGKYPLGQAAINSAMAGLDEYCITTSAVLKSLNFYFTNMEDLGSTRFLPINECIAYGVMTRAGLWSNEIWHVLPFEKVKADGITKFHQRDENVMRVQIIDYRRFTPRGVTFVCEYRAREDLSSAVPTGVHKLLLGIARGETPRKRKRERERGAAIVLNRKRRRGLQ